MSTIFANTVVTQYDISIRNIHISQNIFQAKTDELHLY